MRRRKQQHIEQLGEAIQSLPIRKKVFDEAMEWFVLFGELVDEQHVAIAVVEQVLAQTDPKPEDPQMDLLRAMGKAGHNGVVPLRSQRPDRKSVRELLFYEALHTEGLKRDIARVAIAVEAAHGGKVTDPRFAARHGLPDHGSLGMHVCGYPEKLAQPPYVDQAHRLFGRFRALRDRIDYDDPGWFDPMAEALIAFRNHGSLPRSELVLDWLLADAEMDALWSHKRGNDVAELMAAFDAAAKATSEERETAVQAVAAILARDRQATQADAQPR